MQGASVFVNPLTVVGFIDNLGVLSSFCKGASSIGDYDAIVHTVMLQSAHLNLSMWWEHVDSDANIADGGSRIGVSDPVAAAAGVKLKDVAMIAWPAHPRDASAQTWLDVFAGSQ